MTAVRAERFLVAVAQQRMRFGIGLEYLLDIVCIGCLLCVLV